MKNVFKTIGKAVPYFLVAAFAALSQFVSERDIEATAREAATNAVIKVFEERKGKEN